MELAFPLKRTTVFRETVSPLHINAKSKAANNTLLPRTPAVKEQQEKRELKQVVCKAKSKALAELYSLKHCAAFHLRMLNDAFHI